MYKKLVVIAGLVTNLNYIHAAVPSFVADVLARDLDIGGIKGFGHIGLATAPNVNMSPTNVLEAMSSPPHIQENTITSFKQRTTYWGSRGGRVRPKSQEAFTIANRIVKQYFACPRYTITTHWEEGQINEQFWPPHPLKCAEFRCDTLINYAYQIGNGIGLPTYNTLWTTPKAVFNSFPLESTILSPSVKYSSSEPNSSENIFQNMTNENLGSIDKNRLKNLDTKTLYQMIVNTTDLTEEQIRNLFSLFSSSKVDDQLKIYFYDYLSFQKPIYLTHEIIRQSKKEKGQVRYQLLAVLQSIYQHNENQKHDEILAHFKELKSEKLSQDEAGIVYRGIATLSSGVVNTKNANLMNVDKIHIDISSLTKDPKNETKYVKDIIHNLDNPDDRLVVTATYEYLTQLLIASDLKGLSKNSKKLFLEHLNRNGMNRRNQSQVYSSAYIEFKAALKAKDKSEIPHVAKKLMISLDSEEKESVPYGFSDYTKNLMGVR